MPKRLLKLRDVLALFDDKAQGRFLAIRCALVELLEPDIYGLDFLDAKQHTIAVMESRRSELLLLEHESMMAA